jgi:hypothetical protein
VAEALDPATHRRLGVDLYNKAWSLIEKKDRSREEDDELLHCAHASAYHWLQVGTQANRARSEWQCSRVNVVLGHPEAAIAHAERCLELVEGAPDQMEEFDLPSAYEALTRAYALAGDGAKAKQFRDLGLAATSVMTDEDDRRHLEEDFSTIRL